MAVKDWKTNPDENITISGINIGEGCPPSGINNAIRQLMADVKTDHDTQKDTNTELAKVMTGATASAAGTSGNVPTPAKGAQEHILLGDASWKKLSELPDFVELVGRVTEAEADVVEVATTVDDVLKNPNLQGVAHVVETWHEETGAGWYRVWSNGWCEQGDYVSTSYANVTFYKEFIDTEYALVGVGFGIDTIGSQEVVKKTNGFSTSSSVRTSYTNGWRAEGYIR